MLVAPTLILSVSLTLGPAQPLRLDDELAVFSPSITEVGLQVDRFDIGRRRGAGRQSIAQADAPAAVAVVPVTGGGAAQAAAPATSGEEAAPEEVASPSCDIDCETAREDATLARYVMRSRARTLRTHRAFAIATWSTMLVTEVLGTIQAVNQDTWFGRGNCASDPSAFACEQSSMITGIHLGFAFTTTALYTTTGVLAIAAPDPENASSGEGRAQSTLRLHKTLAWVHGVGMVLLPILGLLSARPQILGIDNQDDRADFSRAMRTTHVFVGLATFAALTVAGALEF
ncbi:MAG: hypothetical protein EPO40_08690 [Myxococcaceae bacterium]|nr:MAG: hypothetical protein EPO40_08690 [Myxococcaceae bacterium]